MSGGENRFDIKKRFIQRCGHCRMRDPASMDIQTVAQMWIIGQGPLPTLVGQCQQMRQGGVVQRKC